MTSTSPITIQELSGFDTGMDDGGKVVGSGVVGGLKG